MDTINKVKKREEQEKVYLTWDDINKYVDEAINVLQWSKINYIYGIPRGGIIIATLLSYKINKPLLTDISMLNDCSNVLLVDDIADSGNTLKEYMDGREFAQIYTICYKEKSIIQPWYNLEVEENDWIVFPWEAD